MAAFTTTRRRFSDKPGRKVFQVAGTFNGNDTTATLAVPKGNIIDVRGTSYGTASLGNCGCSDTPTNGLISSTGSINITRDEGASATGYFITVEYDSQ